MTTKDMEMGPKLQTYERVLGLILCKGKLRTLQFELFELDAFNVAKAIELAIDVIEGELAEQKLGGQK